MAGAALGLWLVVAVMVGVWIGKKIKCSSSED